MTQDEITRMAQEAGFVGFDGKNKTLTKFAALVAAHEREKCAKLCDVEIARIKPLYSVTAESCSKLIRARGTT